MLAYFPTERAWWLPTIWLVPGAQAPATRFTQSVIPYVRTDGAVVANNWADLTDGTIQNPINVDEFGSRRAHCFGRGLMSTRTGAWVPSATA